MSADWRIACWGDSFMEGNEDGTGHSVPSYLAAHYPFRTVFNGGQGGNSSAEVATRMLAATDKYNWITIIWCGINNSSDPLPDWQEMVAALTTPNYILITIVFNSNTSTGANLTTTGSPGSSDRGGAIYNALMGENAELIATFRVGHYMDAHALLVNGYDPGSPEESVDFFWDRTPQKFLYQGFHCNALGYQTVANALIPIIDGMGVPPPRLRIRG
jgi:lysophospholipase L1-like esterase